jgi:hypothetical protein
MKRFLLKVIGQKSRIGSRAAAAQPSSPSKKTPGVLFGGPF